MSDAESNGATYTYTLSAPTEVRERARYEFTTCEADNYKLLSAEANKLGAEGWQLVTVDDVKLAHQTVVGFFQREVV